MDLLKRALREALDRNAAETERWTRYKEQHEGAKANIQEFAKSLEVDIMVPIGTKALIPGRLYHTNEIVVSHSGTYYSKCSAHKALEICQNRLNVAATRLEALETEAGMHRNKLELPLDFDAFSSQEIIETYDEEEEKRWRDDHKKKMKEHKRKEAEERQKQMNGQVEDDIFNKLEELELMEELENELEGVSEVDDDTINVLLNRSTELPSDKKRISHFNDEQHVDNVNVSTPLKIGIESTNEPVSLLSDSDYDDEDEDDDVPAEFKEIEKKTKSMANKEKLKIFKTKLAEVQDYIQNCRPRTIGEISHKTDKMFLSEHLLGAIETIEDELNCDQYLNGENFINDESDSDTLSSVVQPSVPTQTKPILKKTTNKNSSNRKISFALEDDVKSFDGREEPSKISTTVIFDHGPVLNLTINHSEATFNEANEKSDVIRSPVDIYKRFAECTLNETNEEQKANVVQKDNFNTASNQSPPQEAKYEAKEEDVGAAKAEVKELLDNIFGSKNVNEPDPLPDGNFVDTHQPKRRVSLFKQRRLLQNK